MHVRLDLLPLAWVVIWVVMAWLFKCCVVVVEVVRRMLRLVAEILLIVLVLLAEIKRVLLRRSTVKRHGRGVGI